MAEDKVEAPVRIRLNPVAAMLIPQMCPTRHDDDVEYIRIDEARRVEHQACLCLHTEPCQKRCTCIMGYSSHGCSFCCSYGSEEQQRVRAEHLRKLILLGLEVEKNAAPNARQRAELAAEKIYSLFSGMHPSILWKSDKKVLTDIITAEFEK